jgi:hypothetical protein
LEPSHNSSDAAAIPELAFRRAVTVLIELGSGLGVEAYSAYVSYITGAGARAGVE